MKFNTAMMESSMQTSGLKSKDPAALLASKTKAQNDPEAVGQLGQMYENGEGVTPSFRRARELYQRAIELGDSQAVKNMQTLTEDIQKVS